MSTGTKQRHRQTPTQALQARIKELEAQLQEQTSSAPATTQEVERLTTAMQTLAEHLSSVTEHAFSLGRKDAGDLERRVARRRELTTLWGVFDGPSGTRFWGPDHQWHQTWQAPSDAVYPWSESDARRLARMLAGQAPLPGDELDTSYLEAQFIRVQEPAPVVEETPVVVPLAEAPGAAAPTGARHAKAAPVEQSAWMAMAGALTGERLTLSDVEDALAQSRQLRKDAAPAQAESPTAEEPAPGISVPAPKDMPGYGETPSRMCETVLDTSLANLAEVDEDQELLTALGRSIPATTRAEEPVEADTEQTQIIDVAELRDLTGNGETQAIPIIAEPEVTPDPAPEPVLVIPPMPKMPPIICPADTTIRPGVTVRLSKARPK